MRRRRFFANLAAAAAIAALLLQGFIPIASLVAAATASILPFPGAVICTSHGDGAASPAPHPDTPRAHHVCCIGCLATAVVAPEPVMPPSPAFSALQPDVWLRYVPPFDRVPFQTQPRAPPAAA
jgi:hypothetical protein